MIDTKFEEQICTQLAQRIEARMPFAKKIYDAVGSFYVAGNSLNEEVPNDFDLYPVWKNQFDDVRNKIGEDNVVCVTKNAVTAKIDGHTVQFCNYFKNSLDELLESFDFAHVQVGARFTKALDSSPISNVDFTPNWLVAKSTGQTFYTHSEYPISSLIRINKYIKRGNYIGKSYIRDVIRILTDILNRGIEDYDDFKDQLDAIDLGLFGDDASTVLGLFHAFQNVKPTPSIE
jgi:hypothetical protein